GRYLHSTGRCYGLELKAPPMRDFDWAYLGSGSFWSVRATRHGWWHSRFALIASEARRRIGAKWRNRTHAPQQTTCTGCKRRRAGKNHLLAHGLVTSSEATKKKGFADVVTSQFS